MLSQDRRNAIDDMAMDALAEAIIHAAAGFGMGAAVMFSDPMPFASSGGLDGVLIGVSRYGDLLMEPRDGISGRRVIICGKEAIAAGLDALADPAQFMEVICRIKDGRIVSAEELGDSK